MFNAKKNKLVVSNDHLNKKKDKISVMPVRKQILAPLRPVFKADFLEKNCTDKTPKNDLFSELKNYHSTSMFPNAPNPAGTNVEIETDIESVVFLKREKWLNMTENEKSQCNQWIKKYLNQIKNDVVTMFKTIVDFRGGDILQDELSELSSISSLVDITPKNKQRTLNNQTQNDYLTVAIQLKELQERHKEVTLELERNKNTLESLLVEMNKEKNEKEVQTDGLSVEKLENNFEQVSFENITLRSELDTLNETISNLKHGLEQKNNELNTIFSENLTLNSKVENLVKKVKDVEQRNSEKVKVIEDLYAEKNKFKCDFIEISRERDEAAEETIGLKNKLIKMNKELVKLKAKSDEKRTDFVNQSMWLSEHIDEMNNKTNQILHLEEKIARQEEKISKYTTEILDQTVVITNLEANEISLKKELHSWETRAGCWINTFVRNEFESKIEQLERETDQLKIQNRKLSAANENSVAEKNEQTNEMYKIVEMKQAIIDQQEGVIKLMRELNLQQTANSTDRERIQYLLEKVFHQYDEAKQNMLSSEELVKENRRLRIQIEEFKQRAN